MRIVSLVPSLTETLHDLGLGTSVVGVTKFCVHPETARQTAQVVGGTKDPDVTMVLGLRPDLVLCDEDENKPEHVEALRRGGPRVHVTRISSVADAARELAAIGALVGRAHEAEKAAAEIRESAAELRSVAALGPPVPVFVPVWKKPLMTMNGRTYLSDLVATAGGRNVFSDAATKYFETSFDEVRARGPQALLLPTEPYRFREPDRGYFAERLDLAVERIRVVDGEALTWFGTRTREGLGVVAQAVASLREAVAGPQRP